MAQPYVGEIRMFAGSFAPTGWAFCQGQHLPISENDALFVLIGTRYGGDGQSDFALPDLRGRIPIHHGNGFTLAQAGGVEEVTLTTQQIPVHSHAMLASGNAGGSANPTNSFFGRVTTFTPYTDDISVGTANLNGGAITPLGGSQPHTNFQPYLCINFIISLYGIFPSPT